MNVAFPGDEISFDQVLNFFKCFMIDENYQIDQEWKMASFLQFHQKSVEEQYKNKQKELENKFHPTAEMFGFLLFSSTQLKANHTLLQPSDWFMKNHQDKSWSPSECLGSFDQGIVLFTSIDPLLKIAKAHQLRTAKVAIYKFIVGRQKVHFCDLHSLVGIHNALTLDYDSCKAELCLNINPKYLDLNVQLKLSEVFIHDYRTFTKYGKHVERLVSVPRQVMPLALLEFKMVPAKLSKLLCVKPDYGLKQKRSKKSRKKRKSLSSSIMKSSKRHTLFSNGNRFQDKKSQSNDKAICSELDNDCIESLLMGLSYQSLTSLCKDAGLLPFNAFNFTPSEFGSFPACDDLVETSQISSFQDDLASTSNVDTSLLDDICMIIDDHETALNPNDALSRDEVLPYDQQCSAPVIPISPSSGKPDKSSLKWLCEYTPPLDKSESNTSLPIYPVKDEGTPTVQTKRKYSELAANLLKSNKSGPTVKPQHSTSSPRHNRKPRTRSARSFSSCARRVARSVEFLNLDFSTLEQMRQQHSYKVQRRSEVELRTLDERTVISIKDSNPIATLLNEKYSPKKRPTMGPHKTKTTRKCRNKRRNICIEISKGQAARATAALDLCHSNEQKTDASTAKAVKTSLALHSIKQPKILISDCKRRVRSIQKMPSVRSVLPRQPLTMYPSKQRVCATQKSFSPRSIASRQPLTIYPVCKPFNQSNYSGPLATSFFAQVENSKHQKSFLRDYYYW